MSHNQVWYVDHSVAAAATIIATTQDVTVS